MSDKLRYPVGHFEVPDTISQETLSNWINDISTFPQQVRCLVQGLRPEELEQTYRPDGWNVKQVVHHCGDSHINALVRFKLALTEDCPTIRPYREELWAELADGQEEKLANTLEMISGLHRRWGTLLRSLDEEQLDRKLIHPDYEDPWTVRAYIGNYAWHCRHHLEHMRIALGKSFVTNDN